MLIGLGSFMFRYSVGTNSFQPEHPLDAVGLVKKAAEFGADLVQFAENLPLDDYTQADLLRVKEVASKNNIVLEAGTAGATKEILYRHLEIAKSIDAKLVRVAPHAPNLNLTYHEIRDAILLVLPEYERAGVSIGIENHFTMKSEDLVALMQEIDHPLVGTCVDTGNSIAQQEWPLETVKMLAPFAKSLHLKDYDMHMHPEGIGVNVRGCPLGEGMQDIQEVMGIIQHYGTNINVVLEQWMPKLENEIDTLKQEEEWIRRSLANGKKFIVANV
ncbi:sugar phosphate isomerase/epimerase family protein [Pontibacillus yanchengensis]|uniref:Xylose isomerase-like TIM barrel domain-containing protein n=1 Tax=Pontibacillus yanchengensis Y32 TaxID=1385514 RepID=A0A0A2TYS5_9BACI|nr:sugar phosphate isomerase/epimerase family protein [Pontibacillus yanchengensis]KGP74395.1 hypothetical protein N782_15210 [Pontibacillus yanchengensis Y32]